MPQLWIDIPGYESLYQVSNDGQVKSYTVQRITRWDSPMTLPGRILKPETMKTGYHRVVLTKNKIHKKHSVHYLVLLAFVSERPEGYYINHIDGNKLNNNVTNLEYVTPQDNVLHSMHYLENPRYGEHNNAAKLTDGKVVQIRQLFLTKNYTKVKLAGMFDVTDVLIGKILRYECWTHVP